MKRITDFCSNEGGNIAMITAILIIPIMSAVGSVIDYTNYVRQKNNIQHSLDAAGLAAGAEILSGNLGDLDEDEVIAAVKDISIKYFEANLKDQVNSSAIDFRVFYDPGDAYTADKIELQADFSYKTVFGAFIGVDKVVNEMAAKISLGNRTVEVAMVLDNSGSMYSYPGNTPGSERKIETLKSASKSLVDTIFDSANLVTLPDPIKFSLVPFASSVNVGTENADAQWMDVNGRSNIHHENFDWLNTWRTSQSIQKVGNGVKIGGDFVSRFDLFDALDVDWTGCIEMRPWPHNVEDSFISNTAGKDYDQLFVPFFAPDEPDDEYADKLQRRRYDYRNYAPYKDRYRRYVDHDGDNDYYYNSYLYDFRDADGTQLYVNQNSGNPAEGVKGSVRQIERTNWMFKYQANKKIYRYKLNNSIWDYHGPNFGCTARPIFPLSTVKQDVKDELDNMIANGSTNIQQGLTWGWRTLSSKLPFDEGRNKSDDKNLKIVILLTDGNNYYGQDYGDTPNQSRYGAWGYARQDNILKHPVTNENTHNRWSDGLSVSDRAGTIYQSVSIDTTPERGSEFEVIMNVHTAQACRNIKADGVTIFAVAFDVPSSGGVRNLMESCSGSGVIAGKDIMPRGNFFFDVGGSELVAAFENIAQQISQLRVAS